MDRQCLFCECLYPDEDAQCAACREPNPAWEKRERERLLDIGYESAWPWTGVPTWQS
jgi:hypothetical protein